MAVSDHDDLYFKVNKMTEWTKGPWKAYGFIITSKNEPDTPPIASTSSDHGRIGYRAIGAGTIPERHATAQFIAKAPDLCDALKKLSDKIGDNVNAFKALIGDDGELETARNLIAELEK